jgi:hypothetical protein
VLRILGSLLGLDPLLTLIRGLGIVFLLPFAVYLSLFGRVRLLWKHFEIVGGDAFHFEILSIEKK